MASSQNQWDLAKRGKPALPPLNKRELIKREKVARKRDKSELDTTMMENLAFSRISAHSKVNFSKLNQD